MSPHFNRLLPIISRASVPGPCIRSPHLAILIAAAFKALAQEPSPPQVPNTPADRTLEDELRWLHAESILVTTATLHSENLSHAPATVRVVTARQIRDRGYRSLPELLRDLPGVDVLEHTQQEAMNRVGFRGVAGNNKFIILQNGVRVNSPTGEPIIPIADNFALYSARQVEVVYGPASALYGADAATAVINIITDSPADMDTVKATFEAGEFNSWYGSLYGGRKLSDIVSVSLGAHYQHSEEPDLSDVYPQLFVLPDLKTFEGRVVIPAAERRNYRAPEESFSTYARMEIGQDATLGFTQSLFSNRPNEGSLPQTTNFGSDAHNDTLLLTAYAQLRHTFSDALSGRVNANYSRYEQLPGSVFNGIFGEYQDHYKFGLGERYQVEPVLTLELGDHEITGGVTAEYFESVPHTPDLNVPYDTGLPPGQQGQTYVPTPLPMEIFSLDYYNIGSFVQGQSRWTDRLTTTVGLRFDHNSDYSETLNPRLGIVYQLGERSTMKALYGEAFIAPSPFFRYENFGSFSGARDASGLYVSPQFRIPNPDLEPEKIRTAEVSFSHRFSNLLELTATGHYQQVDNYILLVSNPSANNTTFVPGALIRATQQNRNVGELEAFGGELSAESLLVSDDDYRVDLWASFSYTDGDLVDKSTGTDYALPYVSREMVKSGVTLNYKDRFVLTVSGNWLGGQTGFAQLPSDPNFNRRLPDFGILNVHAEWRPTKHLSVYIRVKNLLDERYFNGNASVYYQSPQDPRWVLGGVRLEF